MPRPSVQLCSVRDHSESLLSELDPLELLLADSEELLLLSLDGPPEGAELDFSAGTQGRPSLSIVSSKAFAPPPCHRLSVS